MLNSNKALVINDGKKFTLSNNETAKIQLGGSSTVTGSIEMKSTELISIKFRCRFNKKLLWLSQGENDGRWKMLIKEDSTLKTNQKKNWYSNLSR